MQSVQYYNLYSTINWHLYQYEGLNLKLTFKLLWRSFQEWVWFVIFLLFWTYSELLMIDGDKTFVSNQPFASFLKVNSLQSWEYYAKIALILSFEMNYSIVIIKYF